MYFGERFAATLFAGSERLFDLLFEAPPQLAIFGVRVSDTAAYGTVSTTPDNDITARC